MPNITIYANAEDYENWKLARRMFPSVSKKLMDLLRRELPAMIEEERQAVTKRFSEKS